jgi:hypothetical protein
MGTLKHHAIVVTSWDGEELKKAHKKAKKVFQKNFEGRPYIKPPICRVVSHIIEGLANKQYSFFIAPDGSKEGWAASDDGDNARKEFLDWLQKSSNECDYVEVIFGEDCTHEGIVRSKHTDDEKYN